jgi:hypothetical protein
LNPIMLVIDALPKLAQDVGVRSFFESNFSGVERLTKMILCDFFRHGFDGSGADNFMDAGSCIDGRLTSAWNWCSMLDKKPYAIAFRMTGFTGFDGDFQT